MWELVKAGGWLMLPLVLCSIFTVAISIERFIRLKRSLVLPKSLMMQKGRSVDDVLDEMEQDQAVCQTALGYIFKDGIDAYAQGEAFARAQMEATASARNWIFRKKISIS